jgi:hypothetical protein
MKFEPFAELAKEDDPRLNMQGAGGALSVSDHVKIAGGWSTRMHFVSSLDGTPQHVDIDLSELRRFPLESLAFVGVRQIPETTAEAEQCHATLNARFGRGIDVPTK